ncbi:MAG: hypothetical protein KGI97_04500, partial [Alphaproteobacteria bacterium]|nr:hypothetical protein [Alphaproteobacteria bacterium]
TAPGEKRRAATDMTVAAFGLKSKAGLAGYDLVSRLAKSLHQRCESLGEAIADPAHVPVVKWHIDSLKQLLALRIKGSGGTVGTQILAELDRLDGKGSGS